MKYSPPLDGLRALCVAFTLFNHIPGHPEYLNGTVGVDGFFALSGFLITSLLSAEWQGSGRVRIRSFYIRRAFRIIPLYYTAFALYALVALALSVSGRDPARLAECKVAAPAVLAFLGEYRPAAAGTFFGHSWTLGIEEKYYLVWPLLFVALQALRPRWRLAVLATLAAACWLLLDPDVEARGYGGLAIGSFFGLLYADRTDPWRAPWLAVRPPLCVLLWCATYAITLVMPGGGIHVLLTLASALLIGRVAESRGALARFLSQSILVFIGRRSYGIYLIHVLIANAARLALARVPPEQAWLPIFAVTLVGAALLASILKVCLEDPLIRVGKRLSSLRLSAPLPTPERVS